MANTTMPPGSTPALPKPEPRSAHRMQSEDIHRLQQKTGAPIKGTNIYDEPKRGFWEDPQRVAIYRNLLRARPADYQAPGIDRDQLEQAYQYMKFRNGDKPWTEWDMLNEEDPGTSWLRQMTPPDVRLTLPADRKALSYIPGQQPQQITPWDDLPGWQQAYLTMNTPQAPGIEGRPLGSRIAASTAQAGLAALTPLMLGSAVHPVLGISLAAITFAGMEYQGLTGKEIPVMSDIFRVFNLPAEGFERAIGMVGYAKEAGLDEVMQNLPAAWTASQLAHNVSESDTINFYGPALGAVFGGWEGPAKADEVWRISEGYVDPQKLEGPRGAKAIQEAARRIQADPEHAVEIVAETNARFGDTGLSNENIYQTLLDPSFAAPFIMGRTGAKVADLTGHKRLATYLRAEHPAKNLLVDWIPFPLQNLVTGITGKAGITGSPGLLAALQGYKHAIVLRGHWAGGEAIPDAHNLDAFDKRIAGLTTQGKIAELLPRQPKKGIAGIVQFLTSLTPASQAHALISTYWDNLGALFTEARSDPVMLIRMLDQAAGVKPVAAGNAGEAILKAPTTATIQDGLRAVIQDGFHEKLLAEFMATDLQRKRLNELAAALGETNPGSLIEQMNTNMAAFVKRLQDSPNLPENLRALASEEGLKDFFKPYLGDNPTAWDVRDFQTRLMVTISDRMDKWIAQTYGLKPDPAIFRLSQVMKGMQSLLLLGVNPAYFVNNAVNNIVTRGAVGAMGFMTPKQIDAYMDRFGLIPHRLREGLGPAGDTTTGSIPIQSAMRAGDGLDKVQDIVDAANKKMGLFSRWSAKHEQFESSQAYTIGILRFMKRNWKRGKGMRKMSAVLEAMLDQQAPGVTEAIYQAAEAGLNIQEVETALLGAYIQPQLDAIVSQAAAKILPNAPAVAEALIKETGVQAALEQELANAQTPEQIDAAISRVMTKLNEFVDEAAQRELVHRAEEVANIIRGAEGNGSQGEGWHAVLSLFTDLQVKIATRWIRHFADWQELMNRKDTMKAETFDALVRERMQQDAREWERINAMEEQTVAGMLRAIGLDTPAAREFTSLLVQQHKNWKDFYSGWDDPDGTHHPGRNEKLKNFWSNKKKKKGESYEAYQQRISADWKKLQAELDADYRKAAAEENRLQQAMNEKFSQAFQDLTGRPAAEAMSWREQVMVIRMQMQEEMSAFRRSLENGTLTAEERRAAWSAFIQRYNGLIAEMKSIEVEGAYRLANEQQAAGPANQTGEIRAAQADAARQPAPAGETEADAAAINAELNTRGEAAPDPEAAARLKMAADAGITEKDGSPVQPSHLVNIVNEYLRGGKKKKDAPDAKQYTPEQLREIPTSELEQAIKFNKIKHGHELAQDAAALAMQVDQILKSAERGQREAALKAAGLMSRRQLRDNLLEVFKVEPEAVDVAMRLIDKHAERWAKINGIPVDELIYDRYAATHFKAIIDEQRRGLMEATPAWYYSQLQRSLETMPNRMTAEALEGFLKGKAKNDELKWTGFDIWLQEKKARGEQVTRQEAVAFVRSHQIRIKEVMLGGEFTLEDTPNWRENEEKIRQAGYVLIPNDEIPAVGFQAVGSDDLLMPGDFNDPDLDRAAGELDLAYRAHITKTAWALQDGFTETAEQLKNEYGISVLTRLDSPYDFEEGSGWENDKIIFAVFGGDLADHPGWVEGDSFGEAEWTNNETYMKRKLPPRARAMIDGLIDQANEPMQVDDPARFFRYTDQLGTNYRELLLEWDRPQDELLAWEYYENRIRAEAAHVQGKSLDEIPHWEELTPSMQDIYIQRTRVDKNLPNFEYAYHWPGEINVLAHARISDRTNKAGEKILYIEEIQSDLHEQGREKGYKPTPEELAATKVKIAELEQQVEENRVRFQRTLETLMEEAMQLHKTGTGMDALPVPAIRWARENNLDFAARWDDHVRNQRGPDLVEEINQLRNSITDTSSLPPNAPFKTTWPDLVVKRLIRYASENGYDRIAWANGKEHADRYSLSNHVDELHWETISDTETALVGTKDGQDVFDRTVPTKELANYVGQEIAEKITGSQETRGAIIGNDLAVGGHGMRKFYDEMIPSLISKYIKKWGGQLDRTDYGGKPEPAAYGDGNFTGRFTVEPDPDEPNTWLVLDFDKDIVDAFGSKQEADDYANIMAWHNTPDEYALFDGSETDITNGRLPFEWNIPANRIEEFNYGTAVPMSDLFPREATRQSFKITPDMRKAAMEGQPLFERSPRIKALESTGIQHPKYKADIDTPEFKEWFGSSQLRELDTKAPMVLWHSTDADFEAFRNNLDGEAGIHFGDIGQARDRARAKEYENPRYIPAYVRLENPYRLTKDLGGWDCDAWSKYFKQEKGNYYVAGQIDEIASRARQWRTAQLERPENQNPAASLLITRTAKQMEQQGLISLFKEAGYDGYTYPNQYEGKPGGWSYAVFDATQIKSIYNAGTWQLKNGNMYYERMPVSQQVQRIREMSWADPATLRSIFEGGTPTHLKEIASFIMEQRRKYTAGEMTARDVAKAYLLTISSIGSNEKPFEGVLRHFQENGIHFVRDGYPIDLDYYAYQNADGQWMVRPEEITAAWLMTDEGKAALDAIERGVITDHWQKFITARNSAFGRFGGGPESGTGAWFTKPHANAKTLADIREVTRQINAAKGDPTAISQAITQLYGISTGKEGFIKHLLGFGDQVTVDAQEINFWTGNGTTPEDAAFIRQRWHSNTREISEAIREKIQQAFYELRKQGIGADVPEETFLHIAHHWLWDAMKQTETTHQGMYRAQRKASRYGPDVHAAVDFVADGRAVISAINAPDVNSMMHELGHVFRRDLPEKDLDTIAKWGGLRDASELRLLEAKFLSGELREGDPDYQRYVDAEEKFARGWERYLAEGDAPTPELRSVFHKFTQWLLDIYKSLKKQAGRVIGFNQQPQFAEYAGTDIHEQINGTRIRDIFDRLLVADEEVNRPQSFGELVKSRIKWMKDYGRRYANYTGKELENAAKEWVISNLLKGDTDLETARAHAERMWDEDIVTTPSGERYHESAYWDAVQEIEKNPTFAPWVDDVWTKTTISAEPERQLTRQERTIIERPVAILPGPIKNAIQNYARTLLADLQHGGGIRQVNRSAGPGNDADVVAGREGATWYLKIYDHLGKPRGLKAALRNALEKIIAGTEDENKPYVRMVKQEILGQLTGELATDSGIGYDPAVMWYLGRKKELFANFSESFETATQEWLDQHFGKEADQAMNEYLLWTVEGEPEIEFDPEPMHPIAERAELDAQADAAAAGTWEAGDPIPLDQAMNMELEPAGERPIPPEVEAARAAALEGLKGKRRAYAEEVLDWIATGQTGMPPTGSLGAGRELILAASVEVAAGTALRNFYLDGRKPQPVSDAAPGAGLQVKRTYNHAHGDYEISAIVYLDGAPVAYLPTAEAARPFAEDGTRLLGLDPDDPGTWIIYQDGSLGKINPENPGRPFYQAPEPPPAVRLDNQVFTKRTKEMTPEEAEYALTHDEMTGLKNRRAYQEAEKLPVQVVLDVEGLKFVNDTYGHDAGDQVIKALANSISQVTEEGYRGSDRGDEFLMQFATEQEAIAAVDRVEQLLALQKITTGDNHQYAGLGVSAGIGRTLHDADLALNRNKSQAIAEGRRANRGEKPTRLKEVTEQSTTNEPSTSSQAAVNPPSISDQSAGTPGELPGIPPAEFTLQQQTAAPEEFKPQAQPPQESLFNRQEYMRGIEERKVNDQPSDDPNRLFESERASHAGMMDYARSIYELPDEEILRNIASLPTQQERTRAWKALAEIDIEKVFRLRPDIKKATVPTWIDAMREVTTEAETITGAGWLFPDGTIHLFERYPQKGYITTHWDTIYNATGGAVGFGELVKATGIVRVDRYKGKIVVEAFTRLTAEQIDTLTSHASQDGLVMFDIEVSKGTMDGSISLDFAENLTNPEEIESVLRNVHRRSLYEATPAHEHKWITALKERYQVTEKMETASSYLAADGTWIKLTGPDDHDAAAKVVSGMDIDASQFMRNTGAIRVGKVDVGEKRPVIYLQLMRRPTDAQLHAIFSNLNKRDWITIMVGAADEWTESFPATDHSGINDFLDQAFERRRFYEGIDPALSFSATADFPSPLSGYVGNKRSMLQAGHYNEILLRSRGQGYNKILEAFGGSGLLGNAFQKRTGTPRLLNELDEHVVNFHRQAKEFNPELLAAITAERDRVMEIFNAYPDGGGEAYGAIQDYWKDMQYRLENGTPAERAAMTAILNSGSLSVMGGGQKLISGASTTDGNYVWRIAEDSFDAVIDQIKKHGELLQDVEITQEDARAILAAATPHELVLLDPPYVQRGADDERVTGYREGADLTTIQGALDFIEKDMKDAQARGVPMIYTNNAHPAIVAALQENGFHIRLVEVRSQNRGGQATMRLEVVAWNDAVGPADKSFRAATTKKHQEKIGSGRMEYLQYKARMRQAQRQAQPAPAVGEVPLGGTPTTEPMGQTLDEIAAEHLTPLMNQVRDDYKAAASQRRLKIDNLGEDAQQGVRDWLKQIQGDLSSTKYAAMAYGENLRDAALLNYSRRYGFDSVLGMILPYQFWYTRSMTNWARRTVDHPSWFAMYYRMQRQQEEMEKKGLPSRLRGKTRMPAPWLPDWAGGAIWTDPMKKLMPFTQFTQPLERWTQDKAMIERRAEQELRNMAETEEITAAEAEAALASKTGGTWERAIKAAEAELDKDSNPASLVTQMVQPSLFWNIGSNIAAGTPEKISPLPGTRLAQSIRTATKGTIAEPLGNLAGWGAWPEEQLRKAAGLSQYGEWGDYYIDRQLSNMAADGTISADDALVAMNQRSGPAFDEAVRRTEYELMLRTPGAPTLQQLLSGNIPGTLQSLPTILFPGGLFPEGELKQRNLKGEYDAAWKAYKEGDDQALNTFFREYPEYETRLALWDKPEERLRQFLVSQVWDKYTKLERPNKAKVREFLGSRFEEAFLNPESRSYEAIPIQELALWARMMHGRLPETEKTAPITELDQAGLIPEIPQWPPEMAAGIEAYQNERDQAFPGIFALQQAYFDAPEKNRKQMLQRFPQLRQYWDWKKQYEAQHPELAPYFEESREKAKRVSSQELQQVQQSSLLLRELYLYGLAGQPLSPGAQQMLLRIRTMAGSSLAINDYADAILDELTLGQ